MPHTQPRNAPAPPQHDAPQHDAPQHDAPQRSGTRRGARWAGVAPSAAGAATDRAGGADALRDSRAAAIVAAATRLFAEHGYEQTTMRRIAGAVGVSATALYLYFPDKETILRAIAANFFKELLAALGDARGEEASEESRFIAGLYAYVAFGRGRPDEYRVTFMAKLMASPGPGRPAAPCGDIDEADRSFGILRDGVTDLMRTGRFRHGDPLLVAESVWCALHGLTSLLLDQASHLESEPDRLVEQTIGMVMQGLSP